MALRTSVASGNFGTAGTWDTGVPVDGDSFLISAGHVVIFNVDQSGFATGMLASTVNGTLQCSTSAGTYYLKMAGNLTIAAGGSLLAGSVSTPLLSNVTFTIAFTGNFSITGAGTIALYGAAQVLYETTCLNAENAGSTVIETTNDPTSWANGSLIRISDITGTLPDTELRTILSTTSNSITLTAGLTNAKATGAIIHLVSRNIKILGNGVNGSGVSLNNSQLHTGLVAQNVEFRDSLNCINLCTDINLAYCSLDSAIASGIGVNGGTNNKIDHCYIRVVTPINVSGSVTLTNSLLLGATNNMLSSFSVMAYNTRFLGGAVGVSTSNGIFVDCTFQNTLGFGTLSQTQFFNCLFLDVTRWSNYNGTNMAIWNYTESLDDQQVVGAFKSHTRGGITSKNAAILDSPRGTDSYNTVLESATFPGFWQQRIMVLPEQTLNLTAYLRKDTSMAFLPRVQVFETQNDPLITGLTPIIEQQMSNSIDTWESFALSLTNTTDDLAEYIIRFEGMNATGNMYSDLAIVFSSASNRNGRAGCRRCN